MRSGTYFRLQTKRAFWLLPTVLLVTFVTVVGIVLTAFSLIQADQNGDHRKKITIGLVGNLEDTHLGIGVKALQEFDSSRFSIDFREMTEEDAVSALESRNISGFIRIPDEFVGGILTGKNIPAEYVTLDTPNSFGGVVMNEIATAISDIITETQVGIYGMQRLARSNKMSKGLNTHTDVLNLRYIDSVLGRAETMDIRISGVQDALSMGGYYVCGVLTFFLLVWGISCYKILVGNRSLALYRSLAARGLHSGKQVLSETAAFFLITLCSALIPALLAGVLLSGVDLGIAELADVSIGSSMGFLAQILPAILMFVCMHKLIYELFTGTVSTLFALFLVTFGMGYLSGCFYPNTFFPQGVQAFASALPSGVGFAYLRKTLSDTLGLWDVVWVLLYTVGFFALTVFARTRRMAGDRP